MCYLVNNNFLSKICNKNFSKKKTIEIQLKLTKTYKNETKEKRKENKNINLNIKKVQQKRKTQKLDSNFNRRILINTLI